jgi:hypothetical protein
MCSADALDAYPCGREGIEFVRSFCIMTVAFQCFLRKQIIFHVPSSSCWRFLFNFNPILVFKVFSRWRSAASQRWGSESLLITSWSAESSDGSLWFESFVIINLFWVALVDTPKHLCSASRLVVWVVALVQLDLCRESMRQRVWMTEMKAFLSAMWRILCFSQGTTMMQIILLTHCTDIHYQYTHNIVELVFWVGVTSGAGSGCRSFVFFLQFHLLAFCPDLWEKFCADHGIGASLYRVCSALSLEQHIICFCQCPCCSHLFYHLFANVMHSKPKR